MAGQIEGELYARREFRKALVDADDIRRRLATDEDVARISADAKEAADKGISGVPTYVFAGKYAVSGAQPAEQLARAIRQVSAEVNAEAAE